MSDQAAAWLNLYAGCVAFQGRGLLILGPSGSGKSALALQMMAYGATLVADDRTEVQNQSGSLIARCPEAIRGLIEARGIGLLNADTLPFVRLALAIDLGHADAARLPQSHYIPLLGVTLDLVRAQPSAHLAAALLQYLRAGRYR